MKTTRILLVSVLVIAFSTSLAFAQYNYFGVQAGLVSLEDSSISVSGVGSADLSTDLGFSAGIKLGRKINYFRFEGEFDYKTNDLDDFEGVPSDGDLTSLSVMINGFYDINTNTMITPYIGVGVGFSQVSLDWSVPGFGQIADDDDFVFAYQFAVGVAFSASPNTTIDIGYKYFATEDPSLTDVTGFPFDAEYSSHNLVVGARFNF